MVHHIAASKAKKIEVHPSFTIIESGELGNGLTNGSIAEVNGRYPTHGWGWNTECNELVYVIAGHGSIETPEGSIALAEGDVALISKGQKIAWKGFGLRVFIPCIPAWTAEQHRLSEE